MASNVNPQQMQQITQQTAQQVQTAQEQILQNIAGTIKTGIENLQPQTQTRNREVEKAQAFEMEINKIITEGDLSTAFKKFNDKILETGKTIEDFIDNTNGQNYAFLKRFKEYQKDRTEAERKQMNLAREGIAVKIDENNQLQALTKDEIKEKEREIKRLRD